MRFQNYYLLWILYIISIVRITFLFFTKLSILSNGFEGFSLSICYGVILFLSFFGIIKFTK